jgi:hypothetical protein
MFGRKSGTFVQGWPSTGGILIADDCGAVELDFLGLDRFAETYWRGPENPDPVYADKRDYTQPTVKGRQMETDVLLGWPEEGGVWVMMGVHSSAEWLGWGRIGDARTMRERCEVIKTLGGVFFRDHKDCPLTNDLV